MILMRVSVYSDSGVHVLTPCHLSHYLFTKGLKEAKVILVSVSSDSGSGLGTLPPFHLLHHLFP